MTRHSHTILVVIGLLLTLAACKDGEVKSIVKHATNPEVVPTMKSTKVQTIISDDGRTRYRITTALWNMFEEAKKPHWTFPKGVLAEELDSAYNAVSTIKCDSAYYNEKDELWSLNGNVHITNANGDIIMTDQLFWNQKEHRLYSDAFIHVEKEMRVIEGYGYESDENLTNYKLRNVSAIFPVDDSRLPPPNSH